MAYYAYKRILACVPEEIREKCAKEYGNNDGDCGMDSYLYVAAEEYIRQLEERLKKYES